MKTISVFIVVGFIFFANFFATTSAGVQCFKVFLVDRKLGDTTSIDCEAALKTVPLLTNDDLDSCRIVSPTDSTNDQSAIFYFKPESLAKINNISGRGFNLKSGFPFVITIDDRIICEGVFWSLYSSFMPPSKYLLYLPIEGSNELSLVNFSTAHNSSSILHSELLRCLAGSR